MTEDGVLPRRDAQEPGVAGLDCGVATGCLVGLEAAAGVDRAGVLVFPTVAHVDVFGMVVACGVVLFHAPFLLGVGRKAEAVGFIPTTRLAAAGVCAGTFFLFPDACPTDCHTSCLGGGVGFGGGVAAVVTGVIAGAAGFAFSALIPFGVAGVAGGVD